MNAHFRAWQKKDIIAVRPHAACSHERVSRFVSSGVSSGVLLCYAKGLFCRSSCGCASRYQQLSQITGRVLQQQGRSFVSLVIQTLRNRSQCQADISTKK